jgi:quinolinate synthase
MKKIAPDKEFIPVWSIGGCACNECPYMRLNTKDKMIRALENLQPQN